MEHLAAVQMALCACPRRMFNGAACRIVVKSWYCNHDPDTVEGGATGAERKHQGCLRADTFEWVRVDANATSG